MMSKIKSLDKWFNNLSSRGRVIVTIIFFALLIPISSVIINKFINNFGASKTQEAAKEISRNQEKEAPKTPKTKTEEELEKDFSNKVGKIGVTQINDFLGILGAGKKIESFTREEESEWLKLLELKPSLERQSIYKWPCIYLGDKRTIGTEIECHSQHQTYGPSFSGKVIYTVKVVTPLSFEKIVYKDDILLISGEVSSINFSKPDINENLHRSRNNDPFWAPPNRVNVSNGNIIYAEVPVK